MDQSHLSCVECYLKQQNLEFSVERDDISNYLKVKLISQKNPKVSIIIPNKNSHELLEPCLRSIYQKTRYTNYEVIVIDHSSVDTDVIKLLDKYQSEKENFKVIKYSGAFNFAKMNNIG